MHDDLESEVQSWIESLSNPHPVLRETAATHLGSLISKKNATKEQQKTILDSLILKTSDTSDDDVAIAAVYALGDFMKSGAATKKEKKTLYNKLANYVTQDDGDAVQRAAASALSHFMLSPCATEDQTEKTLQILVNRMPEENIPLRKIIIQNLSHYFLVNRDNPDKQKKLLDIMDKRAQFIDKETAVENGSKYSLLEYFAHEVRFICQDIVTEPYRGVALHLSKHMGLFDQVEVIVDPPSIPNHDYAIATKNGIQKMVKGTNGMMQDWLDNAQGEPDYLHYLRFMNDVINPRASDAPASKLVL